MQNQTERNLPSEMKTKVYIWGRNDTYPHYGTVFLS